MRRGNMSLIDDVNRMQLAISAAISEAFRTPDVIRMFTRKEPGGRQLQTTLYHAHTGQLRQRLAQVERDAKINRLDPGVAAQQTVEILLALKKLGETLTPSQQEFLETNSSQNMDLFQKVSDADADGDKVLSLAGSHLQSLQPDRP